MKQTFHARLWREGKWVMAESVDPDVATHGRNEQEAIEQLREALALYFEAPNITTLPRLVTFEIEVGAS